MQILILRPPIDAEQLRTIDSPVTEIVQFDEPMSAAEYRQIAEKLSHRPELILRVYGFDEELTTMRFLTHFPELLRFSMARLREASSVESINLLRSDLEYLDLGETDKPLDLRPLKFSDLRSLIVARHTRGLVELLGRNSKLRSLRLIGLKPDKILCDVELPELEQLAITLGGLEDASFLRRFPRLRNLALTQVRGVDDNALDWVKQLPELEWLYLHGLAAVTKLPDLSEHLALKRIDLDGLKNMRTNDALAGISLTPNLDEVSVADSKLPLEAFQTLAGHRKLSAVSIGLGNTVRNHEARKIVGLPEAQTLFEYAKQHELC